VSRPPREFNEIDFRSMSIHLLNIIVPLVFLLLLASAVACSENRLGHLAPFALLFGFNLTVTSLQKRERYRRMVSLTILRFCVSFPVLCWFSWLSRNTPFSWIFFLPHCFAISFSFLMPFRAYALLCWNAAAIGFLWFLQGRMPGMFPLSALALMTLISGSGAWVLERNLALIQKLPREDREKWGRSIGNQAIISFAVLIAGIALTVLLLRNEIDHGRQEALARLRAQAQIGIRNLDSRLASQRNMVEALAAFFEGSVIVQRAEFKIFAERLLASHPSVKAFEWIPEVAGDDRARFEAAVASESGLEYHIIQPESGTMVPAGFKAGYFPIRFVEPFGSNRRIWGMDIGFTPERRTCVDSVFSRKAYTVCRPFRLMQDSLKEWILLANMPVIKNDMRGIAVALIPVENMVREAIVNPLPRDFSVDVDFRSGGDWISLVRAGPGNGAVSLVDDSDSIGGTGYRVRIGAPKALLGRPQGTVDALLMIMGIATSILLSYFLFHARRSSLPLEIKVLERTRELQQVVERAEESSLAKSRFLAQMSHEIRTPLNGVLGMSEAMLHSDISPESRDSVELIKASGMSLLTILNDILDVSKIESGKMRLELKPFRVDALIAEIIGIMRFDADARGVSLSVEKESPVPEWVLGDPLRVRQILMNLLSNALKFTPEGSVKMVSGYAQPDRLEIRIVDSGIGISEEKLERLFQPFEQGDSSTTRRFGGTGLGLVISLQLAKMMGGDILVKSQEKLGSEFSLILTLPATKAPAPAGNEAAERLRKGARLLLAEDNIVNVRVAKALLEDYFEIIDVAGTGKEALQMLASAEYEMVLMDLQMPEMDGMQAAQEIRKHPEWSGIPIIALSANAFSSDRKNCLAAGMQDFLEKPITKAALHRVLAQYLVLA